MDDLAMTDTYKVFPRPTFKRRTVNSRGNALDAIKLAGIGPYSTVEATAIQGSSHRTNKTAMLKYCPECKISQPKKNFISFQGGHIRCSTKCKDCKLDTVKSNNPAI